MPYQDCGRAVGIAAATVAGLGVLAGFDGGDAGEIMVDFVPRGKYDPILKLGTLSPIQGLRRRHGRFRIFRVRNPQQSAPAGCLPQKDILCMYLIFIILLSKRHSWSAWLLRS